MNWWCEEGIIPGPMKKISNLQQKDNSKHLTKNNFTTVFFIKEYRLNKLMLRREDNSKP